MFGKKNTEAPVKPKISDRNIIAKNTKITGDIESDGDFRIDGTLEGTLKTKGRVILGIEGLVKGRVEAENADLEGKITGTLIVGNLLSVKSTANVSGEVVIGKLSVEPGATFNASFSIKGAKETSAKKINLTIAAEKTIS